MRITKVQWSNYRRMPDGQIEVRQHLVLVGPNDTGKSSVLRAINLCIGVPQSQLTSAFTERDFSDPALPLRLSVTLSDLDDRERAAFPDEIAVGTPDTLEVVVEADVDTLNEDSIVVRRRFPNGGHQRAPSREQLAAIGFVYVPAARAVQRELSGPAGAVQSLVTGLALEEEAEKQILKLEADIKSVFESAEAVSSLRGSIAESLSSSLPSPVPRDAIKLMRDADRTGNPLAGLSLTIRDGAYDVPIAEQSDGMRALSLLAILELAHRQAKIVAIDEPETHLHPVAQRAVGTAISASQSQRVVVTHSPAIVSRLSPLDVVGMSAERRARQLPLGAPMVEREDAVRFWGYRLIEPITSRVVVLVEGPSDRILFERIAELAGQALDRVGVTVLELDGGQLFSTAYPLFGPPGFGLKLAGVCDADATEDWARVVGCAPAELPGIGIFECAPDLEGEYIRALGVDRVREALVRSPAIGPSRLMQSCKVRRVEDISEQALWEFCGGKRKVMAALAVSVVMTEADVPAMGGLSLLLQRVQADAR